MSSTDNKAFSNPSETAEAPANRELTPGGRFAKSTIVRPAPIQIISLAPFVTIRQMAAASGLTERAIERKIADGVWLAGSEYMKAPDGRIYISVAGFSKWVAHKGTA